MSAECIDDQGDYQPTSLILDGYIVNDTAVLRWQKDGGFGASSEDCQIDSDVYTVLVCDVGDGRGSFQKAAINLDAEIRNTNGKLAVDI